MSKRSDILCLSHLRWGFVFQRPNHLMTLAARDRRVFFVEEPVYGASTAELEVREEAPNLFVVVPRLPNDVAARNCALQAQLLSDLALARTIVDPVLWFYTPMALEFARGVRASVTVYDCMDELSAFHGAPPAISILESELFERADVVFTGGHSLYQAKRDRHPNIHPFPSSVDIKHFARARERQADPGDQAPIERPRLGYFGVIDERLDMRLIARIADARPAWQIVLVGPVVKIDASTLPQRPNIHYLGQKSYDELPQYLAGWDVAMMPFAQNDATRFISPTKTLEYLAGGRPVVSTPVRDVVKPYGERGLVAVANPDDFVGAVESALRSGFHARGADIDAFLAKTSWQATWEKMAGLVETEQQRKLFRNSGVRTLTPAAKGSVARV
ncbi:MAG TPA: glycosyltransferase family 1 protein [Polyangiaceae bacterium]